MQCACVSCVCTHCNTSNCIISGTPATVSPLQHSATYCNTLQHTITHCNTLQRAATHCNTLQHPHQYHHRRKRKQSCQISIPQSCSTLQHTVIQCSTLQTHCKHTANTLQTRQNAVQPLSLIRFTHKHKHLHITKTRAQHNVLWHPQYTNNSAFL